MSGTGLRTPYQHPRYEYKEMETTSAHFGEHLTLDGYGGDYGLLNDKSVVLQTLSELPGLLDMDKLSEPVVYFAEGNDHKDPGGWTGVVVIKESHISVHTFPRRGFVSVDVYTCKNGMDTTFIKKYFIEAFGLGEIETNFLLRGTKYPLENVSSSSSANVCTPSMKEQTAISNQK
jgi:S-adenosylmethionine decarboxylase